MRIERPLIASDSIDVLVSNCVLNLVKPQDKVQLFQEMFRVLKPGGRAVISDVVCDEDPTPAILNDPELWSGCISGAFREDRFLEMFGETGFYGMEILNRQQKPWHVIDGIEFQSMTVRAYKGKEGAGWEGKQAVVYKGPWSRVTDDDGHTYQRGKRMAVCKKTFQILTRHGSLYARDMVGLEPAYEVEPDKPEPFDCSRDNTVRHPKELKGQDYRETAMGGDDACCC